MTSHRFIYEELKREDEVPRYGPDPRWFTTPSGIFWILKRMREKRIHEKFIDYATINACPMNCPTLDFYHLILNPPLFLSKVEAFLRERKQEAEENE